MLDFFMSMQPVEVGKRIPLFFGGCSISCQQCKDMTFIVQYKKHTSLMHNSELPAP